MPETNSQFAPLPPDPPGIIQETHRPINPALPEHHSLKMPLPKSLTRLS